MSSWSQDTLPIWDCACLPRNPSYLCLVLICHFSRHFSPLYFADGFTFSPCVNTLACISWTHIGLWRYTLDTGSRSAHNKGRPTHPCPPPHPLTAQGISAFWQIYGIPTSGVVHMLWSLPAKASPALFGVAPQGNNVSQQAPPLCFDVHTGDTSLRSILGYNYVTYLFTSILSPPSKYKSCKSWPRCVLLFVLAVASLFLLDTVLVFNRNEMLTYEWCNEWMKH